MHLEDGEIQKAENVFDNGNVVVKEHFPLLADSPDFEVWKAEEYMVLDTEEFVGWEEKYEYITIAGFDVYEGLDENN